MDLALLLKAFGFFFLLILSAFFSGSETALFSLSPVRIHRLQEDKRRGAGLVGQLLRDPRRILATILLSNLFLNIFSTSLGEEMSAGLFGERGLEICIWVMSFLILVFCEIVPKVVAVSNAEKVSLRAAPLILFFVVLLTPVRVLFLGVANIFIRFLTPKGKSEKDHVSNPDRLKAALQMGVQEEILSREEASMLEEILAMKGRKVSEVTTPKEKIFGIEMDTPILKIYEQVRQKRFSRIPVYKKDLNHVIGILYAKDLIMREITEFAVIQIYDLLRPPYFVDESMTLDQLFRTFKKERSHMSLVVNPEGQLLGLVTLDDLIEDVVVDSLESPSHFDQGEDQ